MAYTPTLNDLPAVNNYTPTLADIPETQGSSSFAQRILPDAASGVLNAASGINRFLTSAVNGALGTNLKPAPQYDWNQTLGAGNTLGDKLIQGAAGYAPAGALAEVAPVTEGLAGLGTPLAMRGAQFLSQSPRLSNLANQIAPNVAFGATQNPNPTLGAAEGLGASMLGSIPSGVGWTWGKIADAISPSKLSNAFLSSLGGLKTLADNARSLAQDIRNSFTQQKAKASALYSPIFDSYSNSSIYNKVNPDSVTLYHGSNEPSLKSINDDGIFGGIFASPSKNSALSHGDNLYSANISQKDILSQDNLNNIPEEDIHAALQKIIPKSYNDSNVLKNKNLYDIIINNENPTKKDFSSLGADNFSDASWESQRIRGQLAKNLGYKAVEMPDEHGTSYLMLPGNNLVRGELNTDLNSSYKNLSDKIVNSFTPNLKDMHDAFLQNPTLQNAHNLQSQLGSEIRAVPSTAPIADKITQQNYQRAQSAVLNDINNFLEAQKPGLGAQYTAANANYAQNVAPYFSNSTISKIVNGEIDYPKNINGVFAKPTPAIQKIVQDIGPAANNKILYNTLGTPQNSVSPEKLQAAMQNLDKQGLGDYLLPHHMDFQDALNQKILNKNAALHGAGLLGGALAFHPFGEGLSELVGGLIGNYALPPLIRGMQNWLPLDAAAQAATRAGNKIYPPLRNAATGALLQQGNLNGMAGSGQ